MVPPRVTVLMLAWNAERYIRQAVESILSQTLGDFELLIVEDGSTDGTASIIQSYSDWRIRLVRNPTRLGVAESRQQGLDQARSEYVAILDADDVSFPDRLEMQAAYLDRHPGIDAVGSSYDVIDSHGHFQGRRSVPTDALTIRWRLLFGNCMINSAAMFRRHRALALGGYDTQLRQGEDYDLWTRFAAYGQIAQLVAPLTQWRRHAESLSAGDPSQMAHFACVVVARSIGRQTGQPVPPDVASMLYRDIPQSAAHPELVLPACYRVVGSCLERALETIKERQARTHLLLLALDDIARLHRQNCGSRARAVAAVITCLRRAHVGDTLDAKLARGILWLLLPDRLAQTISQLLRHRTSSAHQSNPAHEGA